MNIALIVAISEDGTIGGTGDAHDRRGV